MTTTILVTIGNSDDRLPQAEWAKFQHRVDRLVHVGATETFGRFHTGPDQPWQTAAWSFTIDPRTTVSSGARAFGGERDDRPAGDWLREELRGLAAEYGQDSIAWTEGPTTFLDTAGGRVVTALFDLPEPPQDATLGALAHDDAEVPKVYTEDDVLRLLWRHFAAQSWTAVPQVTIAMRDLGDDPAATVREARQALTDRRIDMLAARKPRRAALGDLETLAVEVKVTRADFLADVKHPEKQAPWRKAATRHAYAVPAGLVRADEVPEGSGLLAVKSHGTEGWGTVEWVRRAPYRNGHAPQLPLRAQVAILHRLTDLEGRTRGWNTGQADAGTPEELRAALTAAQKDAERAHRRADKAEGKMDAWRTAYALATPDGHPCAHCGEPVKPLNPDRGRFKKWRHLDTSHDAPCQEHQTAAVETEARAAYNTATPAERDERERRAHRNGYNERVGAEPWRAFIDPTRADHTSPGRVRPDPPEPADATPTEGDPAP